MKKINFVSHRQRKLNKLEKQDRKLLRFTLIAFSIVLALTAISAGVQLFFNSRLNRLQTRAENLRSSILSNESIEGNFIVLVHKLGSIATLMEHRTAKQEAVAYFTEAFGDGVLITEINFEGTKQIQVLGLEIVSMDVFTLERVLEQLQSDDVKDRYPNIASSNINRDLDGSYRLTVTVSL